MPKKRHLIQTITAFLLTVQIATAIDDSARLVVRPDSSTVEFGSKVAFFCRADGNPLPPIQWNINGKTADTESQRLTIISKSYGISTLRLDPAQLEDNGTVISCHADNGVGHPVFAEATLLVLKNDTLPEGFPQIVVHPALRTIENGKTAYVSCRVSGDPRPKVLWLRDSIPLDMRADSRYSVSTIGNPGALMIQHAREEDQGIYECIARNIHGVSHSKQANLYVKVRRVPPYFSYKLEKLYRVAQGGSINLTCVAVGYPMPRVFWRKPGQTVNLDDSISAPIGKNLLTLTNVEHSDNFTCVAVSPLGNIEATTQILVLPLPTPPKDVKITGITSTGLTVTWKPPKFDQPILHYVVKYRQRYGESKKWIEVKSPGTKLNIDGLEPFQQYEFTVAAEVEVGVGEASMVIEAQTDEQKPGSPPIKPQARSLSRDSLLVKWSPSERPNGVVTSYNVYYTNGSRDLPIEEWNMLTTKADELLATISELEIDTKYYIRVQAVNSKGTSPLSQVVTVQTIPGLPGQPPGLSAKALDAKRIALTWEKPLFSVPISGYVISYNTTDDVREITLTSPHEKHTVTALNPDTPYSFRVAAYTSRGQGEFTELVHEKTPSPTPSILPKFESTSKSLHIFWNMSSEFNVVMYRVKYCEKLMKPKKNDDVGSSEEQERRPNTKDSEPSRPWATIETKDTHANLTYLMPYTMYEVVVAAKVDDSWAE
ncbi:hypothetical protein WR25_01145 [Diploscapter pachys]|uniref:protein-tyrosine-phosphatase n=1 Tax=Diploscapter pachys TaxID=2018661 RepID=A0A2A2KB41_9BILA|nr:hypothetical protein WR25_01145 [Diploscapter pachys]